MLDVNHAGNLGNQLDPPPLQQMLIGECRGRGKSSRIYRWYSESCGGIMNRAKQTVVDCSTSELSFLVLQLLSNNLACVCVVQSRRDVGKREVQVLSSLSLSLSEV